MNSMQFHTINKYVAPQLSERELVIARNYSKIRDKDSERINRVFEAIFEEIDCSASFSSFNKQMKHAKKMCKKVSRNRSKKTEAMRRIWLKALKANLI